MPTPPRPAAPVFTDTRFDAAPVWAPSSDTLARPVELESAPEGTKVRFDVPNLVYDTPAGAGLGRARLDPALGAKMFARTSKMAPADMLATREYLYSAVNGRPPVVTVEEIQESQDPGWLETLAGPLEPFSYIWRGAAWLAAHAAAALPDVGTPAGDVLQSAAGYAPLVARTLMAGGNARQLQFRFENRDKPARPGTLEGATPEYAETLRTVGERAYKVFSEGSLTEGNALTKAWANTPGTYFTSVSRPNLDEVFNRVISKEEALRMAALSPEYSHDRHVLEALSTDTGRVLVSLGLELITDPLMFVGGASGSKVVRLGDDGYRINATGMRAAEAVTKVTGLTAEEAAKVVVRSGLAAGPETDAARAVLTQAEVRAAGAASAARTRAAAIRAGKSNPMKAMMELADDADAKLAALKAGLMARASGDTAKAASIAEELTRAEEGARAMRARATILAASPRSAARRMEAMARAAEKTAVAEETFAASVRGVLKAAETEKLVAQPFLAGAKGFKGLRAGAAVRKQGSLALHIPFGEETLELLPRAWARAAVKPVAALGKVSGDLLAPYRIGALDVKLTRAMQQGGHVLTALSPGETIAWAAQKPFQKANDVYRLTHDIIAQVFGTRFVQPMAMRMSHLLDPTHLANSNELYPTARVMFGKWVRLPEVAPELWAAYQNSLDHFFQHVASKDQFLKRTMASVVEKARALARTRKALAVAGKGPSEHAAHDYDAYRVVFEAVEAIESGAGVLVPGAARYRADLAAMLPEVKALLKSIADEFGQDQEDIAQSLAAMARFLQGDNELGGLLSNAMDEVTREASAVSQKLGRTNEVLARNAAVLDARARWLDRALGDMDPVKLGTFLERVLKKSGEKPITPQVLRAAILATVGGDNAKAQDVLRRVAQAFGKNTPAEGVTVLAGMLTGYRAGSPGMTVVTAIETLLKDTNEFVALAEKFAAGKMTALEEAEVMARMSRQLLMVELANARAIIGDQHMPKLMVMAGSLDNANLVPALMQATGRTEAEVHAALGSMLRVEQAAKLLAQVAPKKAEALAEALRALGVPDLASTELRASAAAGLDARVTEDRLRAVIDSAGPDAENVIYTRMLALASAKGENPDAETLAALRDAAAKLVASAREVRTAPIFPAAARVSATTRAHAEAVTAAEAAKIEMETAVAAAKGVRGGAPVDVAEAVRVQREARDAAQAKWDALNAPEPMPLPPAPMPAGPVPPGPMPLPAGIVDTKATRLAAAQQAKLIKSLRALELGKATKGDIARIAAEGVDITRYATPDGHDVQGIVTDLGLQEAFFGPLPVDAAATAVAKAAPEAASTGRAAARGLVEKDAMAAMNAAWHGTEFIPPRFTAKRRAAVAKYEEAKAAYEQVVAEHRAADAAEAAASATTAAARSTAARKELDATQAALDAATRKATAAAKKTVKGEAVQAKVAYLRAAGDAQDAQVAIDAAKTALATEHAQWTDLMQFYVSQTAGDINASFTALLLDSPEATRVARAESLGAGLEAKQAQLTRLQGELEAAQAGTARMPVRIPDGFRATDELGAPRQTTRVVYVSKEDAAKLSGTTKPAKVRGSTVVVDDVSVPHEALPRDGYAPVAVLPDGSMVVGRPRTGLGPRMFPSVSQANVEAVRDYMMFNPPVNPATGKLSYRLLEPWEQALWSRFRALSEDLTETQRLEAAMLALRGQRKLERGELLKPLMQDTLEADGTIGRELAGVTPQMLGERFGDIDPEIQPLVEELDGVFRAYEAMYKAHGMDFMADPLRMLRDWGVAAYVPHIPVGRNLLAAGKLNESLMVRGGSRAGAGFGSIDAALTTAMDARHERRLSGTVAEVHYAANDASSALTLDPAMITARYLQANRALNAQDFLVMLFRGGVVQAVRGEAGRSVQAIALERGLVPLFGRPSLTRDYDMLMGASAEAWRGAGVTSEELKAAQKALQAWHDGMRGTSRLKDVSPFASWVGEVPAIQQAMNIEELLFNIRAAQYQNAARTGPLLDIAMEFEQLRDAAKAAGKATPDATLWRDVASRVNGMAADIGSAVRIEGPMLATWFGDGHKSWQLYVPGGVAQNMIDVLTAAPVGPWVQLLVKGPVDAVNRVFKPLFTIVNMMHHVGNAIGNMFNTTLDLGPLGALNPRTQMTAASLTWAASYADEYGSLTKAATALRAPRAATESLMDYAVRKARATSYTAMGMDQMVLNGVDLGDGMMREADTALRLLREQGVFSGGHASYIDLDRYESEMAEVFANMNRPELLNTLQTTLGVVRDTAIIAMPVAFSGSLATIGVLVPPRVGSAISSFLENQARATSFVGNMRRTGNVDQAVANVNRFLFNYSDLTSVQKTWMRTIFPFFTWTFKNTNLQAKMLLETPYFYNTFGQTLLFKGPSVIDARERDLGIEGRFPLHTSSDTALRWRMSHARHRLRIGIVGEPTLFWEGFRTPLESASETIGQVAGAAKGLWALPRSLAGEGTSSVKSSLSPFRIVSQMSFLLRGMFESLTHYSAYYDRDLSLLNNAKTVGQTLAALRRVSTLGDPILAPVAAQVHNLLVSSMGYGETSVYNDVKGMFEPAPYADPMVNYAMMNSPIGQMLRTSMAASDAYQTSIAAGGDEMGQTKLVSVPFNLRLLDAFTGIGLTQEDPLVRMRMVERETRDMQLRAMEASGGVRTFDQPYMLKR